MTYHCETPGGPEYHCNAFDEDCAASEFAEWLVANASYQPGRVILIRVVDSRCTSPTTHYFKAACEMVPSATTWEVDMSEYEMAIQSPKPGDGGTGDGT